MSHLIIGLGKDNADKVLTIIKRFDTVYIISDTATGFNPSGLKSTQKISLILLPKLGIKDLVDSLSHELKTQLSKDNITDLDIAVNISSGNGDMHSAIIATVIRLGYGIRLVDINENNEIIEL